MNNFALRSLTAVVFVIVMVLGLVLSPLAFGALFIVIMAVAMQEFYTMTLGGRFVLQQKLGMVASVLCFTLILCTRMYGLEVRWLAVCLLPLLAILISLFFCKDHTDFGLVAYVFAGIVCVGLPLCTAPFAAFDRSGEFNGFILLSVFVVIWFCDMGAYFIGSALGQKPHSRKLAPSISPKKSWWGFAGGLIFGTAAAVLMHIPGFFPYPLPHCVALGVLISLASVCGDLSESMWKRWCGVKDSGNCIPGHGGMYDRFDSSLFAIPFTVIYLAFFSLL